MKSTPLALVSSVRKLRSVFYNRDMSVLEVLTSNHALQASWQHLKNFTLSNEAKILVLNSLKGHDWKTMAAVTFLYVFPLFFKLI